MGEGPSYRKGYYGSSIKKSTWFVYSCPECRDRIHSLDKIETRVYCPSFRCRKTVTLKLIDTLEA